MKIYSVEKNIEYNENQQSTIENNNNNQQKVRSLTFFFGFRFLF